MRVARETLGLAIALLGALGCRREVNPSTQPVTRIPLTATDHPASSGTSPPGIIAPDGGSTAASTPPDPWIEAYPEGLLTAEEVSRVQSQMTAANNAAQRDGAAFTLGRRAPDDTLGTVLSVLPPDASIAFARGMAGRSLTHPPRALPSRLASLLTDPTGALSVASVVGRFHVPVEALSTTLVPALLASDDLDDQLAGTRLLATQTVPLPSEELFYGLRPPGVPSLVKSLRARTDFPATQWTPLLLLVRSRVVANPRAWGNAWVALRDSIPIESVPLQEALRTSIATVDAITALPPAVLAGLRCGDAAVLDRIDHATSRSFHCAIGTEHWRALATAADVLGTDGIPPVVVVAGLQQIIRDAGSDARVLEAIAPTVVKLPPLPARPLVEMLAASRDPGVLAALLEQLALHVQHARALSPQVRSSLVHAPFSLPEASSVEARTHAIELAHALHIALENTPPQARALQHALHPDAGAMPAVVSIATETVRGTLTLTTSNGTVVIQVRDDTARLAADMIVRAVEAGRYNGTSFHRVVPGFVVQGGDPRGDGYGGTDAITTTELSGERFVRGAIGVALAGLDTGGMQFFMVTADAPHLDGRYPYIGRVVEGMDVVDGLMVGDTIDRAVFTNR